MTWLNHFTGLQRNIIFHEFCSGFSIFVYTVFSFRTESAAANNVDVDQILLICVSWVYTFATQLVVRRKKAGSTVDLFDFSEKVLRG